MVFRRTEKLWTPEADAQLKSEGYNEGEVALIKRVRKYGTAGLWYWPSPECAPITNEQAKGLYPAGMGRIRPELLEIENPDG